MNADEEHECIMSIASMLSHMSEERIRDLWLEAADEDEETRRIFRAAACEVRAQRLLVMPAANEKAA